MNKNFDDPKNNERAEGLDTAANVDHLSARRARVAQILGELIYKHWQKVREQRKEQKSKAQ